MRERSRARPSAEPDDVPSGIVRTPAEIGARVRRARKAAGVTLVDAAALAGVGVRFLLELEHGKPTASLGKVLQVLQRLGIEIELRPRRVRPR